MSKANYVHNDITMRMDTKTVVSIDDPKGTISAVQVNGHELRTLDAWPASLGKTIGGFMGHRIWISHDADEATITEARRLLRGPNLQHDPRYVP